MTTLRLGVEGFSYADLHDPARLAVLHDLFLRELGEVDHDALAMLESLREKGDALGPGPVSDAILRVAPHVERFVAKLFGVEEAIAEQREAILYDSPLFAFRQEFAKKKLFRPTAGAAWNGAAEDAKHLARLAWAALGANLEGDEELEIARATHRLVALDDTARKVAKAGGAAWTTALATDLSSLRSAVRGDHRAAALVPAIDDDVAFLGRVSDAIEAHLAARMRDHSDPAQSWVSTKQPHKTTFEALVPLVRPRADRPEELVGEEKHRRERTEPFALTDARGGLRVVAAQVDYCLYCHDRDKDSCSKGLRDKNGALKSNPLGVPLAGCPLFEKISEMHSLRRGGGVISSLATAMIDNPMLAGTGHRICNDCMKGCVYQTQEPVDIPQVETRILVDVLRLPWGYEIWSFLSRWNPLNVRRPYARAYNGHNVLVVGLGPAGYTLAHHLLNEGFGVVAIDGLKLEPMPEHLAGRPGEVPAPLYDVRDLEEPLEKRTLLGFGGVSEYGITVRWDKSFLAVLYLNLVRRPRFRVYGGTRFGGTVTLDDAWRLGFDHVAIASGAGRPTLVPIKNNLIRGIRQASDFLMALQLTGAYKRDSLANLQVRLPAVVIGGGLTAIDTATELQAYYVVQIERTLERYTTLVAEHGEAKVRGALDPEEVIILDEQLTHARALADERALAKTEGREPRIQKLIAAWGGVSLVYRRTLMESPAYRLNHEEVTKSLEEGIHYFERLSPLEAHADEFGAVEAMTFEKQAVVDGKLTPTGETIRLAARTVCVAAGTSPNTTYEDEHPGTFARDKRGYFEPHRATHDGTRVTLAKGDGFFTSYLENGRTVSYYGDNHPKYAGSVVKAMASAKDGYRHVSALFPTEKHASPEARDAAFSAFARVLDDELLARVHDVRRLAPSIVEVVIRAPLAARRFMPGQFYRMHNFERFAPRPRGTPLVMEGVALTGAWTDPERGLLSTIVLEMGASSRLCAYLKPGEPVVLMGPTGTPTETPSGETVLLAGGGLGNAVLFSIARAFKARGSKVIYFAGYRNSESVFKRDEIEAATDQVVWAYDQGDPIAPRREQDRSFRGNIVQAMLAYERGDLGEKRIALGEVERIIAIGSDRMMAAVKEARHGALAPYLRRHAAIGSINSPMQCMMKQICAQCLQRLVDPVTGKEELVYTCFNQDLELDRVDFPHLASRLRQNSVQEKLADQWFTRAAGPPPL